MLVEVRDRSAVVLEARLPPTALWGDVARFVCSRLGLSRRAWALLLLEPPLPPRSTPIGALAGRGPRRRLRARLARGAAACAHAGDRGAGQPYLVRANGLVLRSAAARLRGDLLHVEPAASAPALRRALREAHVAPLPLAAGRPFVVTFEFDAALGVGRRQRAPAHVGGRAPRRAAQASAAPRAPLRAALSAGFTGGGWHAEAGPPEGGSSGSRRRRAPGRSSTRAAAPLVPSPTRASRSCSPCSRSPPSSGCGSSGGSAAVRARAQVPDRPRRHAPLWDAARDLPSRRLRHVRVA